MPADLPNAATITVYEALQLLDARFLDFAAGVNRGEYALWLGSGISRDRVVGLNGVLRKVIEFLRTQVVAGDPNHAFRNALDDVLRQATLSPDEQSRVHYEVDSAQWPDIETILQRLAERYSHVLDITIRGEASDYLLWVAADFCQTFANQEPDAEHLSIVIMVAEGVVPILASANWDGLLESAAGELGLGAAIFRVCVTGEDFRGPLAAALLLKFHGCALRAIEDDAQYRPLLIARWSQIVNWAVNNAFTAMREELVGVAARMRTLMIGMSAQDPNIQNLFQLARQRTAWRWDASPPAHIFGTNEIGDDQKTVLRTAYGDPDYVANEQAILERSCFKAYGKPLLVALVLNLISDKLSKLLERVEMPSRQANDLQELSSGIRYLRDAISAGIGTDKRAFIRSLARHLSRAKAMLQEGRALTENPIQYRPITDRPGHHIANDPNVVATGQCEAANALALLGLGMRDGHWELVLEDTFDRRAGVLRARSQLREARLMFAAHDNADVRLLSEGAYSDNDDDVVIVHSMDPVERQTRSPAKRLPGGRLRPRHVAMGKLARECANLDDLRTLFRQEVGL
jgi:hypothetical protein